MLFWLTLVILKFFFHISQLCYLKPHCVYNTVSDVLHAHTHTHTSAKVLSE